MKFWVIKKVLQKQPSLIKEDESEQKIFISSKKKKLVKFTKFITSIDKIFWISNMNNKKKEKKKKKKKKIRKKVELLYFLN